MPRLVTRLVICLAICVSLVGSLGTSAAEPGKPRTSARRAKPQKPVTAAVKPVKTDLFSAMAGQQVMASFVPQDASVARVSLMNVSRTPLEVSLPGVFAGAPVTTLANVQPGGSYNLVGSSDSDTSQILGSVIPTTLADGTPWADGAAQPAALSMVLQPRQIRQFAVPCVCLQYGNPTPRPEIPYRLVTLDTVSQSPALRALLDEFSRGQLDQPVVQLAAWHFSNKLNWEQLSETGFATDRLGQAATLATRIEADISQQRTVAQQGRGSLSDAAGRPTSEAKASAPAASQPSKSQPSKSQPSKSQASKSQPRHGGSATSPSNPSD